MNKQNILIITASVLFVASLGMFTAIQLADFESLEDVEITFNDPAPGELTEIFLTDNQGEPIEQADIYMSDEHVTTTNVQGEGAVTLPEEEGPVEFTIEKQDQQTTRTIQIQEDGTTETVDTTPDDETTDETDTDGTDEDDETTDETDTDGTDEDDETTDETDEDTDTGEIISAQTELVSSEKFEEEPYNLQIAIDTSQALTYTVNFDETQIQSGTIDDEDILVNEEITNPSDTNNVDVELEKEDQTETETFTVEKEDTQVITLQNPSDNNLYQVDEGEEAEVTFEFQTMENEDYRIIIDEEIEHEADTGDGDIETTLNLEEGKYEWEIQVFEGNNVHETEEKTLEVIENVEIEFLEEEEQEAQERDYEVVSFFSIDGTADEYDVSLEDNILRSSEPISATNSISQIPGDEGTYEVEVTAYRDGDIAGQQTNQYQIEDPPQTSINWISPTEPVDDTDVNAEFEILTQTDYTFEFYINDNLYAQAEDNDQTEENHQFNIEGLEDGTHSYEIIVNDNIDYVLETKTGEFETTEELDIAEIHELKYEYVPEEEEDGEDPGQDEAHLINYHIETNEEVTLEVLLEGNQVDQDTIGNDVEITSSSDLGDLNEGEEYKATLQLVNDEGAEKSDQITFIAEGPE